jgi:predicted PurR-regulated permease PerM
MAASRGTVPHRVVHLSAGAAVTIVATILGLIVARSVFVDAHRPLSWAAAAVVAAVVLDPIVDRLAVHIRRVPAVLGTFLLIGAVAVGGAYAVFDGVQDAVDRLEQAAPEAAREVEAREDRLGEVARDFDLRKRVTDFVEALSDRVTGGDDVLRTAGGGAPTYLVCAILTVFLMTYGPRMAGAALQQDPDAARRDRIAAVVGPAVKTARSGILLTAGWATAVGVAGAAVATVLDLPAGLAVGFTIGVVALLPHVGIVIGSVPLLLLSLGFRSATTAVVIGLATIGLQVFDSMVVRKWISRRSLEIGLLVPWVVALVGYQVYGIGGGAYGLAYAIFGVALLDQLHRRNEQRLAETAKKAAKATKARKATKKAKPQQATSKAAHRQR